MMNNNSMTRNTEDDAALPLLVRKLAVFRKSLVRERGLRIDCEGEIQNLSEKLKLTSNMLKEKEIVAMEYSKKCKELQGQIKEQQEIRSNEQKLEKIFSSFGTKKSIESENKLLKKEILSLKRNRKGYTLRIEELESELSNLQKQNATNLQVSQSRVDMLERNLKDKEEDVIQTKLIYENLQTKMRGLEKIRENFEEERKELLADRDAALIETENERLEKERCLQKLTDLLNTNRVVEDMNNLEKDLVRSRSNSWAGRRSTASFSKSRTNSRSNSIGIDDDDNDDNNNNTNKMSGKKRVQSNGNNNNNILNVNNNNNNNRISIAEEVDNVGFDVLVKEFNVYKLRDFFPKRPAKITIRKQLLTGSISIVVERAGVARIHKAGSIRGASFEAQNTQFFSDSNSTNADIVTFQIDYYNQKSDMFESHQRSKICNAINEALKLSQMNPQNQRLSKQFNLYSDGGEESNYGNNNTNLRVDQIRRMNGNDNRSMSLPKGKANGNPQNRQKSQMSWNGRQHVKNDSNTNVKMQRAKSEENISDELQFFFGL